jgi:hypothetical protein
MQILKSRLFLHTAIALASLCLVEAANAGDCSTPDTNATITTCYFDLTQSPSSTDPAASTVTPAVLNGGIFSVPDSSGTFSSTPIVGTGVLNPFVRIQGANGAHATGVEAGYNTGDSVHTNDPSPVNLLDDHDNGNTNWNHAIQLGSLATVNVGGVDYYQFILDINEQGNTNNAGLSLDEFKLFYADSGDISSTSGTCSDGVGTGFSDCGIGGGAQLAYNMDGQWGGDASILMNYNNFSGSGYGVDLQALVPVSNFVGASDSSYVYLYSKFGATGNTCKSNNGNGTSPCNTLDKNGNEVPISQQAGNLSMLADAGFEEWSTICKTGGCLTVPEPESLALLGIGIIGMVMTRRRVAAAA